ncbi:MAG TPA: cytochrome c biogenesis protein CcdA [Chloroflexia bacterium]|nr:cytochrome c biogenesis protein CcdA [Chloroflexia bacterium]
MNSPDLFLSFLAGLLSFLSPCVFPLVPVYLGYLSGPAVMAARAASAQGGTATMSTSAARWIVLGHALMFMLGFTFIFGAVFGGLASFLTEFFFKNRDLINRVMGIMLIIFGMHSVGLIRIGFLDYTKRLDLRPSQNLGYLRSFIIGVGFAVGWTPCTSIQLGLIFTLARDDPGGAFIPFLIYSLGFGLPFLLAALALGQISSGLKRITRRGYSLKIGNWQVIREVNIISLISGLVLILMGILVLTDALGFLSTITPPINIEVGRPSILPI